ncbi:katanin p80 WD40 repeat-containing subunit B1 homolog [Cucurbita moschata]|uniref:Katanin p80 WD40 repeat-containing subunit B1 homolog n=1 Tax=Cucurbita moschata TaxID=3662 RepID=A0A6J1GRP5_CUCMO|nr:katanin p80 WD40 repeat-containing subunit B1 homolog [Cucurbita moschata]
MAKRGYKLQEIAAHSANVNCLSIGKKACRLFITGGDDHKVNLWAIGKPNSLMSLCGHTNPVESVAFDSSEVLVLGGASSGAIKLWDLEEAKIVRTLSGHRSNCTAVEFHPFGEFFASGSRDTNLKIWDIRKKGCSHTYKGHTQGISTIKFTPDGRWVVSGGFDSAVKVWDLTAGKLLHDFKFHEGHIRSIGFHPLEFLLATGSADKTVKFWDLETFELIGSTRPEATGVRAITFHPDGRTLFSGLDESLKVYSWEPVICHDSVDMGWSTLGDLCIHDGKLLSCSFYRSSVGVWVADISNIEPYGASSVSGQKQPKEQKSNSAFKNSLASKSFGAGLMTSNLQSLSPDYETKEIKNIYIDTTGGKPEAASLSSPKVVFALGSKEIIYDASKKQSPASRVETKSIEVSTVKPPVVPCDSPEVKDSASSIRESITFSKTRRGMLLRPAHVRKPSNSKMDLENLSVSVDSSRKTDLERLAVVDSVNICHTTNDLNKAPEPNFVTRVVSEETQKDSHRINSDIRSIETFENIPRVSSETTSEQESCNKPVVSRKGTNSVKFVNGVAVVPGRTRTLVEKFERREQTIDVQTTISPSYVLESEKTKEQTNSYEAQVVTPQILETEKSLEQANTYGVQAVAIPSHVSETEKARERTNNYEMQAVTIPSHISETEKARERTNNYEMQAVMIPSHISETEKARERTNNYEMQAVTIPSHISETEKARERANNYEMQAVIIPSRISETEKARERTNNYEVRAMITPRTPETKRMTTNYEARTINNYEARTRNNYEAMTTPVTSPVPETDKTDNLQKGEPQASGRDSPCANDRDVIEDIMQSHDVFLSSLRSRLTKLQVVRHFWQQNDMKGAINAMTKLPDHSVQADVISVLIEKMNVLTLDLFSCLLPVLVGLLDSKIERHASLSMEILLKLVAVFGHVITSAVSAPPVVGVDLHAEQRVLCCKQCFTHLQKIQKILPSFARRGGSLARSAQELNLVLQQC